MFLDNAAFLTQLTRLFDKTKTQGTVFVTMKRYSRDELNRRKVQERAAGQDAAKPSEKKDTAEYPLLIRAVTGKTKLSTLVKPQDDDRFLEEYGTIVRVHMDTLKKKDRKKIKESKAKRVKMETS